MKRGWFVSFEGSEGCGKSTQIRIFKERLDGMGVKVDVTREPGGTPIGEEIRKLLQFSPEAADMTPEAELLLFAASRAQLVRQSIRPTLEEGGNLIADRFLDSTTVYQGYARGLDLEAVEAINEFAVSETKPDVTFLLDMDSAKAKARLDEREPESDEGPDRMEGEPMEFYERVREGYLELAKNDPGRIKVIDASRDADEVAEEIWDLFISTADVVHS